MYKIVYLNCAQDLTSSHFLTAIKPYLTYFFRVRLYLMHLLYIVLGVDPILKLLGLAIIYINPENAVVETDTYDK